MIRSIPARPVLAAAIALLLATAAAAQETATPAPAPAAAPDAVPGAISAVPRGVTPEAKAVLERMSAYMRGLQTFAIESRTSRDEVGSPGTELEFAL